MSVSHVESKRQQGLGLSQDRIDIAVNADLATAPLPDDFAAPFGGADAFDMKFGAHARFSVNV